MLIRPTLPYTTLAEFIAAAKQQPGKFNYASAGLGNWTHLFMAYLNSQAGIDQVNVVYRSGAEMLTALLKNEADTAIITLSTALGQIREGKVRALAGVSMRPMPQLPDTPPVGKTIPGFDVAVWHGIAGPAGMDPALVTRINGIFNQVLQVPAVRTAITGRAGRRHRRRHAAAVRRLHQERAEALAGGRQGRRHQTGIGLSRALTRLGGVDQRFLRAGVRFLRAGVRFFFAARFAATFFLAEVAFFFAAARFCFLGRMGLVSFCAAAFSRDGAACSSFCPLWLIAPATLLTTTPVAATAAAPSAAPATDFIASAASLIIDFLAMRIPFAGLQCRQRYTDSGADSGKAARCRAAFPF